jgi:hypothetical protein
MADLSDVATINSSPTRLCDCGCGQPTNPAPRTSPERGWVKGQPMRSLQGYVHRKSPHYVASPTGFSSDCWLWQLAKTANGHGLARVGDRMTLAHRAYYAEQKDSIPDGVVLDHLCRVRSCVNPDHLEAVTQAENCQRGSRPKLTPEQVAEIRASDETQRVIARKYGITQGHVARIRRGQTWREA